MLLRVRVLATPKQSVRPISDPSMPTATYRNMHSHALQDQNAQSRTCAAKRRPKSLSCRCRACACQRNLFLHNRDLAA